MLDNTLRLHLSMPDLAVAFRECVPSNKTASNDSLPLVSVSNAYYLHPAFRGNFRHYPGEGCARAESGTPDAHMYVFTI